MRAGPRRQPAWSRSDCGSISTFDPRISVCHREGHMNQDSCWCDYEMARFPANELPAIQRHETAALSGARTGAQQMATDAGTGLQ